MIERRRLHPHEHVARTGLGVGDVLIRELVDPAVLLEREGFHAVLISP
jgi:hypothetical protein